MGPLHSPKEYLFHLQAMNSGQAKRMWRQHIKEQWSHQCAYCESKENLTIDHIIPQSKGGMDFAKNVVCCCHSCNQSKGHTYWEDWYFYQDFFTQEKYEKIREWMKPDPSTNLFAYRPRKNNAS